MRPEPGRAATLALLAALAGCSSLAGRSDPVVQRSGYTGADQDTQVAVMLAETVQSLQRLATASPAEQAEILANARQGYERAPGGGAQLRYALVLATPGHLTRDPERARQLLRALAAKPEMLAPVERAYALVELAMLDRELGLVNDNQRLLAGVQAADQDQVLAAKRLQAEVEETARVRHQLEEVQAKLAAIATLERNLSERKPTSEGRPK